ncbi:MULTISPECIES: hypothetical protein [Xanthomonas]|uniref:hypothetical protein n=1 Tax=Xanthomonas TaxID=338 RepID=UPI001110D5A8|nr:MULTISPECIES: hypothetical protein [Xanthomonas]MDV0440325.1 hypothetical protein [Xanthomonas sacchari]UYC11729.1 hypothetical protein NUG21_18580 [Xanthomonas sp. CFBP 8445]
MEGLEGNYKRAAQYLGDAVLGDGSRRHFLDFHVANCTPPWRRIITASAKLDIVVPGFIELIAKRLGALMGENENFYEQLLQALCEIVIAEKFVDVYKKEEGFSFTWEPTENGLKNPEFMVECEDWRLLVEVKAPSLLAHKRSATGSSMQIPYRGWDRELLAQFSNRIVYPLDNKIKDFINSAQGKFSQFNSDKKLTYGLLVICWSERLYEAVGPLSNLATGLLTEESYFRDADNKVVTFPHVGGVLVTDHLGRISQALSHPFGLGELMSYGSYWSSVAANPVFCKNPEALSCVPGHVLEKLEAIPEGEHLDPLANTMDFIYWF